METSTTSNTLDKNGPIDICVMWVNPERPKWQKEYNFWHIRELLRKTQRNNNAAAFGQARYRDWGIFRYWFRAVEKNCPWVNKVFLVLEDEDQVPSWINKDNPKLRIVYHREFIPKEALPQFNGPAIETWYSNIPDLSENFISCDDDYFFIGPIAEDLFFENNVPQTVIRASVMPPKPSQYRNWQQLMYNDYMLFQKITGSKTIYTKSHLPEPRKKSFEADILKRYYKDFYNALMYSHFRSDKGQTAWIFNDLAKHYKVFNNKPVFANSKYINLKDLITINKEKPIGKYDMVCFNDHGEASQEPVKSTLIKILKNLLPNKSSFEL